MLFIFGLAFPKGQDIVWKRDPSMPGAWCVEMRTVGVVPGAGAEMVQKVLSRVFFTFRIVVASVFPQWL